jgi:hypothetical protein
MALVKTILKATPQEVIVKWTGSGTDTLTLASLVATGQTVTGTPAATIDAVSVSTSGATTITRNSVVALQLEGNYEYGTGPMNLGTVGENPGFDIAVNMVALGTLILRIRKLSGYSAPAPF